MSQTRRQIGAAWSYGVNASATTIPLPARTIQRGSLVKAVFRYEATNTSLTVTDSAGGVWRVERHFQTNINTVVAWCWNHPGGASVVITGTLAAAQGYRYAFAWEETGGDVTDPAIPESIIKTHGTAASGMSHWVGSDPLADTIHASGAYSGATWTPGGGQTVVGTNQYLYLTAIRGVNVNRRFARHSASGTGTSIAHISMAFRAPDAEYVALAKRRIWVPVSTGGPVTVDLTSSTARLTSSEITIYQSPVALNLNNVTFSGLSKPIDIGSFTGLSLTSSVLDAKSETTGAKKTLFTNAATQSALSQAISIVTDTVVPLETALIKTSSLQIQLPVVLSLDDAINQVVFNKLKSLGYSGTVQDMLSVFFGGTGTLPDRENLWLVSQTGSTGPSIDLWKKHLNGLGYSGAVAEMLKQFWMNY